MYWTQLFFPTAAKLLIQIDGYIIINAIHFT